MDEPTCNRHTFFLARGRRNRFPEHPAPEKNHGTFWEGVFPVAPPSFFPGEMCPAVSPSSGSRGNAIGFRAVNTQVMLAFMEINIQRGLNIVISMAVSVFTENYPLKVGSNHRVSVKHPYGHVL